MYSGLSGVGAGSWEATLLPAQGLALAMRDSSAARLGQGEGAPSSYLPRDCLWLCTPRPQTSPLRQQLSLGCFKNEHGQIHAPRDQCWSCRAPVPRSFCIAITLTSSYFPPAGEVVAASCRDCLCDTREIALYAFDYLVNNLVCADPDVKFPVQIIGVTSLS